MNFLAHLHLAHLAKSSLSGNILADFIRGDPTDQFSPEIVAGIYMHRRVDALTDGLPEVALAKQWFRPETRRVSPISLDIIWDHFLSLHWQTLNAEQSLAEFANYARTQIEPQLTNMPEAFIVLNQHLWDERWLERYSDMDFIANVLTAMAKRRPKLVQLRASWHDLEAHYSALENLFWSFYPQMIVQATERRL